MPSPFPGMDPYLEGHLWPDVHQALAGKIRQQLAPKLKPRYAARLATYVVEDRTPSLEIGVMYPDVEVLIGPGWRAGEQSADYMVDDLDEQAVAAETAVLTAPLELPALEPVEVHLPSVELRDAKNNQLVTAIEILSPINKRDPNLSEYRQKRVRLHRGGVHLIEIDLLRRGARPLAHPRLPQTAYLVTVWRAGSGRIEIWPVNLADALPTVPVPLLPPDVDVPLALSQALSAIYDEAAYDLSIDYTQAPPPPELKAEEERWRKELLQQ